MAVGGGDAFSLPATLMTIILLLSFLQITAPWWLPELAKKYPDYHSFFQKLDTGFTLIPIVLIFFATISLAHAHFTGDLTSEHVANFGSGVEGISALPHLFFASGSPWFAVPFMICASHLFARNKGHTESLFDDGLDADFRARVLRWQGYVWIIVLIGFIPSESFAVHSTPLTFSGSELMTLPAIVSLLILGVMLGFWPLAISKLSRSGVKHLGRLAVVSGAVIISLIFLTIDSIKLDHFSDLPALFSTNEVGSLTLTMSILILLFGWPMFLTITDKVHEKRGVAKGRRWLGLQRTFGHTLVLTWVSGAVLLEPLPHIAGWSSAFWLSFTLTLPLAVTGLFGTLLPMAGLDSRPRPEAWGFFLMMTLAIPLLTIREPLTALLAPGFFLSMTTLPLLATHPEKRPDLKMAKRLLESLSVFILTIASIWGFHEVMSGNLLGLGPAIFFTITSAFLCVILLESKFFNFENEIGVKSLQTDENNESA